MDDGLLGWRPLIAWLVREDRPRTILWLTGREHSQALSGMEALCREADVGLRIVPALEDPSPEADVDLVLLEGEPNWFSVTSRLRWLTGDEAEDGVRELPTVLVPHVGWPYGRRDGYPIPAELPSEHVHPHRKGGLVPSRAEPLDGAGFAPDREHALLTHPFRNGRLTALEDFVRRHRARLRLRVLPGFHGLGVLAPVDRVERSGGLRRLFDDPGAVLLEVGLPEQLEEARLEALGSVWAGSPAEELTVTEPPPAGGNDAAPAEPPTGEVRDDPVLAEKLAETERRLAARDSETRRLSLALLDLRAHVRELLRSNRWRLGDRLGDLFLKVRRRTKTEGAVDRLAEHFRDARIWELAERLGSGTAGPSAQAHRATEERAEGPAPALSVDGLFLRLVARVDPGEGRDGFERSWRRSEERVAAARARGLRERPSVSVIMPTRERAHLIGQAVTSVLEQTYDRWELIVCEDGETAGTREAIEAFGDPRIRHLSIPRAGAAAARNRALETASGTMIAYLDDDNLWHPAFLETLLGALEERPAFPGAFCGFVDVELEAGRARLRASEPSRFRYDALCLENAVDLSTLVHRRELYELFGGFDEELPRHQDWDLLLRYGFVGDLLPVDALLCLYRRNREWAQISSSQRGDRSWERVRASVDGAYREGGPPRRGSTPAPSVTVLFEGSDGVAHAEAVALARELGAQREARIVSIGSAGAPGAVPGPPVLELDPDGEGAEDELAKAVAGGVLVALRPAGRSLELARSWSRSTEGPLIVERDLDEPPTAAAPESAGQVELFEALWPGAVPTGFLAFPPIVPAPPDEVQVSSEGPVRIVGPEAASDQANALEQELAERGLRVAWADVVADGGEPRARALVVVTEEGHRGVGPTARWAVAHAFACRIPVIAVACEELRSLAEEDCLVLAGEGTAGLADAVARTLADRDVVTRLTECGWRRWARRYSPAAAANVFDLILLAWEREPDPEGAE